MVHHLFSLVSLSYTMLSGEVQVYSYMVLISEITTPGINLRWYYLISSKSKKSNFFYLLIYFILFFTMKVPWHSWFETVKSVHYKWSCDISYLAGKSIYLEPLHKLKATFLWEEIYFLGSLWLFHCFHFWSKLESISLYSFAGCQTNLVLIHIRPCLRALPSGNYSFQNNSFFFKR